MDTKEILSAIPKSYDDFVVDAAAWMDQDENIRKAVLERLEEHPESPPSDVLKIICNHLGMTKPLEIVDDEDPKTNPKSSKKKKTVAAL